MKSVKAILALMLWQIVRVLRTILVILCAGTLVYQVFRVGSHIIEVKAVDSWTIFIVPALLIVALIVLHTLKEVIDDKLHYAKLKREFAQDEKVLKAKHRAELEILKAEVDLQKEGNTYIRTAEKKEPIRNFEIKRVSADPESELNALIGLGAVKAKVEEYKALLIYEKQFVSNANTKAEHMRFVGNPGTGKTSIGQIMAGILYREHRVPENKYIEVNASELVGEYMGQTPLIVRQLFEQAAGGVLFIDEAYALAQGASGSAGGSYGAEAVNQILSLLEAPQNKTVVIFAGYKKDMDQFLKMNPGLPSRVPIEIEFPNYSALELSQILVSMLKAPGREHCITREAMESVYSAIKQKINICTQTNTPFGNARYIRNVADELHRKHALNFTSGKVKGKDICLVDVDRDALLRLS